VRRRRPCERGPKAAADVCPCAPGAGRESPVAPAQPVGPARRGAASKVGRIDRQLRGASSHSRFRLPNRPFLAAILLIFVIVAVMVGLGLGIAKIVALATGDDFKSIANQFVLAMLFAPVVAAAAFGLLAKSVTTDWSLPAPSNDDEFVAIFEKLFEDAGDEGLLVFVDEIDRAPPDRIADTLDGLRTFFGKGQCVFVVAADRQALEHALSSWLGESTPEHAANPH
jgi:hypothetical protein